MFVIINQEGKVYSGSFSETRHIWGNTSKFHMNLVVFPLKEEAEDIQKMLGDDTKVIPIFDLVV